MRKTDLVFCCEPDNDLYKVMIENGYRYPRFDLVSEAIARTSEGEGMLILASEYPDKGIKIDSELLNKALIKRLRLYIEYPAIIGSLSFNEPKMTKWERCVISSDFFGAKLEKMRIIAIHDCHFVPAESGNPHIVVARVAGFNKAIFGLPEKVYPILFLYKPDILLSTTKLSNFVSGRYSPQDAWQIIWNKIINWISKGKITPTLKWKPAVRPMYALNEKLSRGFEKKAFDKAVGWFYNSKLLVNPDFEKQIKNTIERIKETDGVGPPPPDDMPIGDGKNGISEGYSAKIYYNGSQKQRYIRRSDCIGESAMALSFDYKINRHKQSKDIAKNLLDYIYFISSFRKGPRSDPRHPAYGLLSWAENALDIYYGDDNARSILGTLVTSALLNSDRWTRQILEAILANLRTAGKYGFRHSRLETCELEREGWRKFNEEEYVKYSPHYQAYIWACYLWAYNKTNYEPFLNKTETAIQMIMEAYPRNWRWTNGITQERARMLLPLSWLIRVRDKQEYRDWLYLIANDLLKDQQSCGAIRESIGEAGLGQYAPPISNEAYGTSEAPLIQENGDPVSDMLYTSNFAFIGLHEANAVSNNKKLKEAEDKLTEFLCRIQINSEVYPYLDGGWYRAFDFKNWEYWASNSDIGWGAWSIESGWTQSWITATLGMRLQKTSLWDIIQKIEVEEKFSKILKLMS